MGKLRRVITIESNLENIQLRVFGMEFINLTDPDDGKLLLSKDGKIPIAPNFEVFERARTEYLPHVFKTPGLVIIIFKIREDVSNLIF